MIEQDLLEEEQRMQGRQSCINCRIGDQSRAGCAELNGKGAEHAGIKGRAVLTAGEGSRACRED